MHYFKMMGALSNIFLLVFFLYNCGVQGYTYLKPNKVWKDDLVVNDSDHWNIGKVTDKFYHGFYGTEERNDSMRYIERSFALPNDQPYKVFINYTFIIGCNWRETDNNYLYSYAYLQKNDSIESILSHDWISTFDNSSWEVGYDNMYTTKICTNYQNVDIFESPNKELQYHFWANRSETHIFWVNNDTINSNNTNNGYNNDTSSIYNNNNNNGSVSSNSGTMISTTMEASSNASTSEPTTAASSHFLPCEVSTGCTRFTFLASTAGGGEPITEEFWGLHSVSIAVYSIDYILNNLNNEDNTPNIIYKTKKHAMSEFGLVSIIDEILSDPWWMIVFIFIGIITIILIITCIICKLSQYLYIHNKQRSTKAKLSKYTFDGMGVDLDNLDGLDEDYPLKMEYLTTLSEINNSSYSNNNSNKKKKKFKKPKKDRKGSLGFSAKFAEIWERPSPIVVVSNNSNSSRRNHKRNSGSHNKNNNSIIPVGTDAAELVNTGGYDGFISKTDDIYDSEDTRNTIKNLKKTHKDWKRRRANSKEKANNNNSKIGRKKSNSVIDEHAIYDENLDDDGMGGMPPAIPAIALVKSADNPQDWIDGYSFDVDSPRAADRENKNTKKRLGSARFSEFSHRVQQSFQWGNKDKGDDEDDNMFGNPFEFDDNFGSGSGGSGGSSNKSKSKNKKQKEKMRPVSSRFAFESHLGGKKLKEMPHLRTGTSLGPISSGGNNNGGNDDFGFGGAKLHRQRSASLGITDAIMPDFLENDTLGETTDDDVNKKSKNNENNETNNNNNDNNNENNIKMNIKINIENNNSHSNSKKDKKDKKRKNGTTSARAYHSSDEESDDIKEHERIKKEAHEKAQSKRDSNSFGNNSNNNNFNITVPTLEKRNSNDSIHSAHSNYSTGDMFSDEILKSLDTLEKKSKKSRKSPNPNLTLTPKQSGSNNSFTNNSNNNNNDDGGSNSFLGFAKTTIINKFSSKSKKNNSNNNNNNNQSKPSSNNNVTPFTFDQSNDNSTNNNKKQASKHSEQGTISSIDDALSDGGINPLTIIQHSPAIEDARKYNNNKRNNSKINEKPKNTSRPSLNTQVSHASHASHVTEQSIIDVNFDIPDNEDELDMDLQGLFLDEFGKQLNNEIRHANDNSQFLEDINVNEIDDNLNDIINIGDELGDNNNLENDDNDSTESESTVDALSSLSDNDVKIKKGKKNKNGKNSNNNNNNNNNNSSSQKQHNRKADSNNMDIQRQIPSLTTNASDASAATVEYHGNNSINDNFSSGSSPSSPSSNNSNKNRSKSSHNNNNNNNSKNPFAMQSSHSSSSASSSSSSKHSNNNKNNGMNGKSNRLVVNSFKSNNNNNNNNDNGNDDSDGTPTPEVQPQFNISVTSIDDEKKANYINNKNSKHKKQGNSMSSHSKNLSILGQDNNMSKIRGDLPMFATTSNASVESMNEDDDNYDRNNDNINNRQSLQNILNKSNNKDSTLNRPRFADHRSEATQQLSIMMDDLLLEDL